VDVVNKEIETAQRLKNADNSGSVVASLNQGLAGDVTPLIIPERKVLRAIVAVESMIF